MTVGVDPAVQAELVALLPRLRRFARGLAGVPDQADDLVQAACERALTRIHQWTPGTRLDSWMFRIIQTIWLDQKRAQRVRTGEGRVDADSPLVGKTVREVGQEIAPGVLILAIRRQSHLVTQPPADAAVGIGDELVAFGTSAQLRALETAS